MRVTPIAVTELIRADNSLAPAISEWMESDVVALYPDTLAEFAGRACYESFHKPNPGTRHNAGYLKNIIDQGHFSVLEHASMSLYVTGVSRTLLAELCRHRFLSFSVVSQRYVDESDGKTIMPPLMSADGGHALLADFERFSEQSRELYAEAYGEFRFKGYPKKEAREAARAFLLGSAETRFVVTGNMRAWRDVLSKRYHVAADAEIQQFAGKVLEILQEFAPHSVQDIPSQAYGAKEGIGGAA